MRRKLFCILVAYVVLAIAIVPAISDSRGIPYWKKFFPALVFGVLFSIPILFACGLFYFGIITPVIRFVRNRNRKRGQRKR